MTFTQTPANQFLNITNVSCFVELQSSQVLTAMFLEAGSTSGARDLGRPYNIKGNVTPETISSSKYYSVVQNGIFFKFGPGRFPTIEFDTDTTGSMAINAECVIAGNLTDN